MTINMIGETEQHLPSQLFVWLTEQIVRKLRRKEIFSILLLKKATVMVRKLHFRFVSSLYVLATLTRGPDDALASLR